MNRSAFITGISQGLGRALAIEFARNNWAVWGTVRTDVIEALYSFEDAIRPKLNIIKLDTSDHQACAEIAHIVHTPISVLVNCAASFGNLAFTADSFSAEEFMNTLAINVVGPTVLARALKIKLMEGSERLIIMMSTGNASLAGNTKGQMLAYRASKSALNQVVRSMAAEWVDDGLTIIALNPGWVKTKMGGEDAPLSATEAAKNILQLINSADKSLNGTFINTDKSTLPW